MRISVHAIMIGAILSIPATSAMPAGHLRSQAAPAEDRASAQRQLAETLVTAINGTAQDRERWVTTHFSPAALKERPAAEWQETLETLARAYPRLDLAGVDSYSDWINIRVGTRGGRGPGQIRLYADPAQPSLVKWLTHYPQPMPETAGKAQAGKSTLAALLGARIDRAVRNDEFSGVALVMKGDTVVLQRATGLANRDFRVPVTMQTRFNLGSMDKMFTSVLIAQLIEAGKLTLDTRLGEVLPDYPNKDAAAKITIRHLLSHSAGLGWLWDRAEYSKDPAKPYARVSALLPTFAAEPLLYEPGSRGQYSNEGFIVLGAIIEKLTGKSWYEAAKANVFDRAGMSHTDYPTIDAVSADRAVGYRFGEKDPLGLLDRQPNSAFPMGYRGNSCGGGYSTAADVARFLRALSQGKLVSPAAFAAMQVREAVSFPNYGHGLMVEPLGGDTLIGHDGGGPNSGINSAGRMLRKSGYTIVVLGNYDAPYAQQLARDLAEIVERQPA